ncbi:MAG: MliC family protein [Janthinobacterium lividum]
MTRSKHVIALIVSSIFAVGSAGAATTQTSVVYACDGGTGATAKYDTSSPGGGAIVAYGGHTLAFSSAMSGSGARYTTAAGAHAITPLEWWTKGRGARLSELGSGGIPNRTIATCHETR